MFRIIAFESQVVFDDNWLAMLRNAIKPAPVMALSIVLATSLQVMTTHPTIARAVWTTPIILRP